MHLPAPFDLSISDILQLYRQKGQQLYSGEAVSQLEHALQCASLAEAAQQPISMIVASLLHDIGHLLPSQERTGVEPHAERASHILQPLFDPSVTEPIRLHVQAKRYLCAVEPHYWQDLSHASQRSLEAQGGVFGLEAAQAFISQPFAAEAVQLRRWDDCAKVVGLSTAPLEHFAPMLEACRLGAANRF